jgi:DNA-binding NarL/FixJ family response regulator
LKASIVRALVVDDYELFRGFVCSTLAKMQNLKVIGEASDGLEAVHKAEELKPDLIVLDIGLPTLNGIEVARQIRKSYPQCKILFMSQGSSIDVAQEAFSLGALGYVVKAHAGSELLIAVETVCQGGRFISKGLPSHNWTTPRGVPAVASLLKEEVVPSDVREKAELSDSHRLELYADGQALLLGLARFVEAALKAQEPVIVVATSSHLSSFHERLQATGVDVATAIDQGLYVTMDVDVALSAFMVNDLPDPVRFRSVFGDLISSAAKAAGVEPPRVVAFGEIAPTLWARGQLEAAIQLEHLTGELARTGNVNILCGYVSDRFQCEQTEDYQRICSEHTAVFAR